MLQIKAGQRSYCSKSCGKFIDLKNNIELLADLVFWPIRWSIYYPLSNPVLQSTLLEYSLGWTAKEFNFECGGKKSSMSFFPTHRINLIWFHRLEISTKATKKCDHYLPTEACNVHALRSVDLLVLLHS
jgi:hypothetical protein